MTHQRDESYTDKSKTTFVLHAIKPFRWVIALQIILCSLWAVDFSLRPYLLKIMIDRIIHITPQTAAQMLFWPAALYALTTLGNTCVNQCIHYMWVKLNSPLKKHLGSMLMARMMQHSQTFFQDQFAGNLASKIKDVMSAVPDLIWILTDKFFAHFMAIFIAGCAIASINITFAGLLFLWLAVFLGGTLLFSKKAQRLCFVASEARSVSVGTMVDILTNIISVHLFAAKKQESQKLNTYFNALVLADQKRDLWFMVMFGFKGLSLAAYQALCFILLVQAFKKGMITAGDFMMIVTLNTSIVVKLFSFADDVLKLSNILGDIDQGLSAALKPLDIEDIKDAKELHVTKGEIVFEKVKFSYKGCKPLFDNKSVTIKAGQKVGLVGYSGGGKTTFVNLILRLYDATDGRILIDGQDIGECLQDSLHKNIAMIPQDPSLFHRSLADNIGYGKGDSTKDEIVQAAKRANADDFIQKLPKKYDSLVGERGIKLSGGQRQRIAIARAILKNAPILILDEATSQLDSVTEKDIQASLWDLMQGKTTIVIAHRLSTLLRMDRILVFDHGKIKEDGTHEELLKEGGLYKSLWQAQVGGFLPD